MSLRQLCRFLLTRLLALVAVATIAGCYASGERVVIGVVNLIATYALSAALTIGIVVLLVMLGRWLLRPFHHGPGGSAHP